MKRFALLACLSLLSAARLSAQATTTASQDVNLSGFAGISGVWTGFDGGRNLSITAGADLALYRTHGTTLAAEVRGTSAFDQGDIDSQKTFLGGVQAAFRYRNLRPYADFLFGRGEINYAYPGARVPGSFTFYTRSSSNLYVPGGGVDLNLTRSFSLKADAQFERYSTPVTTSGHLYATAATIGLVYKLHLGRGPR